MPLDWFDETSGKIMSISGALFPNFNIDPRLPVVGYEASENLEAACRKGFEVVGNLRVLVAQTDRAGS